MSHSGKLVIAAMLLLAVVLTAFGLWYQRQATQRAIALWGPQRAAIIGGTAYEKGMQVRLLRLGQPGSAAENGSAKRLDAGTASLPVLEERDITHVVGLSHVRRALVEDRNFDWEAPTHADEEGAATEAQPLAPIWLYALQFVGSRQSATLLFNEDFSRVGLVEDDVRAVLAPRASVALRAFLTDQLGRGQ